MIDLMFWGMILISSLVIGMSIYILIAQALLNNELTRKFNEQKRELRRAFGWEEYNRWHSSKMGSRCSRREHFE